MPTPSTLRVVVKSSLLLLALAAFCYTSLRAPRAAAQTQTPTATAEGLEFFEKKIRPVLAASCAGCHSAKSKKPQGGLVVDSIEAMLHGGASGQPAVVPGNLDKSLLIIAIRQTDAKLQMPPGDKLTPEQIKDFEAWVTMGAPAPRGAAPMAALKPAYNFDEAKKFWSFQPLKQTPPPAVKNSGWARGAIDQFLLAKLEEKGLKPVGDADRRTLLRRATFDLIGLPPTPAEVDAFLADKSAQAFEKVVDRLLASKAYGEKWGRHWLDVVRYADTAGCNSDYPIPAAYRYRNYVIDAFNADKPYDQFIREQLAGDLLPTQTDEARRTGIIATGYIASSRRFGSRNRDFNLTIDDTIDNLGKAFLGLSVSCARCHDHKFDPIPQRDYYALYGIFNSTRYAFPGQEIYPNPAEYIALETGEKAAAFYKYQKELSGLDDRTEFLTVERGVATRNLKAKQQAEQEAKAAANRPEVAAPVAPKQEAPRETANINGERDAAPVVAINQTTITGEPLKPADYDRDSNNSRSAQASTRLPDAVDADMRETRRRFNELRARPVKIDKAYAVTEGLLANAKIHRKGERANLGEEVPRGFLTILGGQQVPAAHKTSGRELLADWITRDAQALAARVMVNRIWAYHFGKGLVATPNDFGARGTPPTHPELLDYLAARFIAGGWSVKQMHKLVMLTRAYGLASGEERWGDGAAGRRGDEIRQGDKRRGRQGERTAANVWAANEAIDVANDYLWRFNRRRMLAEEIRDSVLVLSATLNPAMGGEHPFPAENTWRFTQHVQFFDVYETNHRSVYVMQQRLKKHPFFETFDGADQSATTDRRTESITPVQALFLMNNKWLHAQADQFAVRVGMAYDTLPERIDYAYRLVLSRSARPDEVKEAADYMAQAKGQLRAAGTTDEQLTRAALASYLRVLLSGNEFLYVD